MRKYDHLFFDLDNTLWNFDANSRLALFETLKEFGLDSNTLLYEDFYKCYKTINESLWDAYRKKQITKPELIKSRFQKTFDQFRINGIDPVLMNDCYLKNMSNQNVLIDGVPETLNYLKNKGYQMHIITNGFQEVQHQKLKKSGLNKYFNRIFISEEIQAPKPDKRIFRHAVKNCNAKKSKSIMIGDSWEVDIIGASNFGIDQVFFQHNHNNQLPTGFTKTRNTANTSTIDLHNSFKTYFISRLINLREFL